MEKKISIRRLSKKDNSLDLWARREWLKFNKEKGYRYSVKKETLVAFEGKKPIGYADYSFTGGVCHLKDLLVSRSARGRGIGKTILEGVEKRALELDCHKIELSTSERHGNLGFYGKMGFEKVGELPDGKFHFTWFLLEKKLKQ